MDEYRLINLTGHRVVVLQWNDEQVAVPSRGYLRVESSQSAAGVINVDGIRVPIIEITENQLTMPSAEDGVLYIVSGIVAAKANREDFVVPSRVQRDTNGRTVGCRAFARIIRKEV